MMYTLELVDRNLREGRGLGLAIRMVRRDNQRDDIVNHCINSREGVHDFIDGEHWCCVNLHECVKLELASPVQICGG
jgi:hypothetical protein